jgi:SAM-dependent methyltransferase
MDGYGLDVPLKAPQWAEAGVDNQRFVCGDGAKLPFKDDSFDVVLSFGVIEHIGTVDGNWRLRGDYRQQRQAYASEIVRVTRGGGMMIIGCPNKSCPIDPAHGQPAENRIRSFIFRKTGLNLHRTWGDYYLPSHREVRQFFSGTHTFRSLPLKGYFAFGKFKKFPVLRPIESMVRGWVEDMPQWAANSCLNPFIMVQMTKQK